MKKNLNFMTPKTIFLILSLVVGASGFSQTNPALEMADGDGNPTANSTNVTGTTTIRFRNNTNNPSGNTFATYSSPSALTVSYALSNQQYTQTNFSGYNGAVFMGYTNEAVLVLMNAFGAAPVNSNYTSSLAAVGTGIDATANRAVQMNCIIHRSMNIPNAY